MNKNNTEQEFLEELNIFRNETLRVRKFFYTELTIRELCNDKKILEALNYTPDFWNTVLSSLQHSTFMTLGRIFDTDSNHNIHVLIKIAENNRDIFNQESFKKRWKANGGWLQEYIKTFYSLTVNDLKNFKKYIAVQQKEYEDIYENIRHYFAHNKYSKNEDIEKLFAKVNVGKLEKFCVRLGDIHEALWQLYHNGKGPMLPPKVNQEESSTKIILQSSERQEFPGRTNVQIIQEAKSTIDIVKIGFEKIKNQK